MDRITAERRSANMGRIKGKGTGPERRVRSAVHSLGYRFRVNRRDLPGSPDLVFPSRKLAIFVHGCFWHRHISCKYCYHPKSNIEFWARKFNNNVARDKRVEGELTEMGWRVETIWECETKDLNELCDSLQVRLK